MYYARGRVHPNVVKGEREKEEKEEEEKYENDDDEEEDEEAEGEEGKEEERTRGRKRRTRRRTKGEYVCDVCGGHYEEPGVVARQRLSTPHTHTTLNQSPKPPCEIPLRLMAYSFFRYVSRSLSLSFSYSLSYFYPTRRLANVRGPVAHVNFHNDFNSTKAIESCGMLSFRCDSR